MNVSHLLVFLSHFFLFAEACLAYPRIASVSFPPDAAEEISPLHYDQLLYFPHQVAICDLIFKGTVLSTNDGYSAHFAIDETVWGNTPTTNIVIRRVNISRPTELIQDDSYLILAFTNDWWHGEDERSYTSLINLYNFPAITNRPKDNAIFSDYRIMDPRGGAINFKDICYNGTNYWDGTKMFMTNLVQLARVQNDERRAILSICSLLSRTNDFRRLPFGLRRQIIAYKYLRYDIEPGK